MMKQFHPELKARRCVPQQFALSRRLARGRSHAPRAGHRRGGTHRFTSSSKRIRPISATPFRRPTRRRPRRVRRGRLIFPWSRSRRISDDNEDIIRMCAMRIRVPDQWRGRLPGDGRFGPHRRAGNYGAGCRSSAGTLLARIRARMVDYSERRMVEALRADSAGRQDATRAARSLSRNPGRQASTSRSWWTCDPAAARIEVDLRDNPDCLPCGLNLSEACSRTAAMVGIFNSIDHTVPKNAGSFRRIEVLLRENCIVGIPRHPTSTSVATTKSPIVSRTRSRRRSRNSLKARHGRMRRRHSRRQ